MGRRRREGKFSRLAEPSGSRSGAPNRLGQAVPIGGSTGTHVQSTQDADSAGSGEQVVYDFEDVSIHDDEDDAAYACEDGRTTAKRALSPPSAATVSIGYGADSRGAADAADGCIARISNRLRPVLGFVLMAASALCFSVMSLSIHLLSGHGFTSFEIVVIRAITIAALIYLLIVLKRINPLGSVSTRLRVLLVVRSLVGTVALNSFVYAFSRLPLSDATCIVFLAPAITAALAGCFLGERVGGFGWSMICLSFSGVVLIARPAFLFGGGSKDDDDGGDDDDVAAGSARSVALLAAFTAAVASATVNVLVRKLKGVHGFVIVAAFVTISTPITLVIAFAAGPPGGFMHPNAVERDASRDSGPLSGGMLFFLTALVGISGFLGQITKTRGLQLENASAAAMMRNLDLPFSFVWQALFLAGKKKGEEINGWTGLGATIILGASLAMGYRKWRRAKYNPSEVAEDMAAGGDGGAEARGGARISIDDDSADGPGMMLQVIDDAASSSTTSSRLEI